MRKLNNKITVLSLFLICGCVGSPAWHWNNPNKIPVTIKDQDFYVLPIGDDYYDSWRTGIYMVENDLLLKERNIQAIETVTHCKVIDIVRKEEQYIYNAKVKCTK